MRAFQPYLLSCAFTIIEICIRLRVHEKLRNGTNGISEKQDCSETSRRIAFLRCTITGSFFTFFVVLFTAANVCNHRLSMKSHTGL